MPSSPLKCPVHFRLYRPEDFTGLYAIEEACFEPERRFSWNYMYRLVDSTEAATWIAEKEGGGIAGFAIVEWFTGATRLFPRIHSAYIQTIEVAPGERQQGIGSELLRRVESSGRGVGAATISLHVDTENASAIRLYEAHGYQRKGREENYYAQNRPALVYSKSLAAEEQPR